MQKIFNKIIMLCLGLIWMSIGQVQASALDINENADSIIYICSIYYDTIQINADETLSAVKWFKKEGNDWAYIAAGTIFKATELGEYAYTAMNSDCPTGYCGNYIIKERCFETDSPFYICSAFYDTVRIKTASELTDVQWFRKELDDWVWVGAGRVFNATEVGEYAYTAMNSDCATGYCGTYLVEERCLDLAICKTLASGQAPIVETGQDITFTIYVFNQGDYDVDSILLTDYLPNGMALNDSQWADNQILLSSNNGLLSPQGLLVGDSTSINITLKIDEQINQDSLINYVEITAAQAIESDDNRDRDSIFDDNANNDGGGAALSPADDFVDGDGTGTIGGENAATDEDDHDPAVIYICPSIYIDDIVLSSCIDGVYSLELSVIYQGTTSDNILINGISFPLSYPNASRGEVHQEVFTLQNLPCNGETQYLNLSFEAANDCAGDSQIYQGILPCEVAIENVAVSDCSLGKYRVELTFSYNNAPGKVAINDCTFLPTGNNGIETFMLMNLECTADELQTIQVEFVDEVGCMDEIEITPPCPKPKICIPKSP